MYLLPPQSPASATDRSAPDLSGVLLDGMAEALLHASESHNQSQTVLMLITEIHDAAVWLIDDPGSAEVTSLHRVLAAARAHHDQISRAGQVRTIFSVAPSTAPRGSGTVLGEAALTMIMSA